MLRRIFAMTFVLALGACVAPPPRPAAPPPATNEVPIPPVPPRSEPNRFSHMTGAQLRTALGAPAFTRKEGVTELWRYDAPSCRAFFFLYGSGAQQQVGYVQTLPAGKDDAADPACLNALQKAS